MTKAEASQLARARWLDIRESRIEDYLFIGGLARPSCCPEVTARSAAERLGVSKRTIQRYRQLLRQRECGTP